MMFFRFFRSFFQKTKDYDAAELLSVALAAKALVRRVVACPELEAVPTGSITEFLMEHDVPMNSFFEVYMVRGSDGGYHLDLLAESEHQRDVGAICSKPIHVVVTYHPLRPDDLTVDY